MLSETGLPPLRQGVAEARAPGNGQAVTVCRKALARDRYGQFWRAEVVRKRHPSFDAGRERQRRDLNRTVRGYWIPVFGYAETGTTA